MYREDGIRYRRLALTLMLRSVRYSSDKKCVCVCVCARARARVCMCVSEGEWWRICVVYVCIVCAYVLTCKAESELIRNGSV